MRGTGLKKKRLYDMKYKIIKYGFIAIVAIWAVMQVIFVHYYGSIDMTDSGDASSYRALAMACYEQGAWYPNDTFYTDNFIFAPGYVNYQILILHIFGSFWATLYLNVLLNVLIVWLLFSIGETLFDIKVAYIASLAYVLLLSNLLAPSFGYTELPFIVLSLLAIRLTIKEQWYWMFVGGVVLAVANWVRPLAIAWLVAACCYIAYSVFLNHKGQWWHMLMPIVGMIVTVCLIGGFTRTHFSDFNYASTTGGWNLIMGANDNCNGTYNDDVFHYKGEIGYLDNPSMSYKERDRFYKYQAIEWIKNNPTKYLSYIPKKVKSLFLLDNQYDMSGDVISAQPKQIFLVSKVFFSNKLVRWFHNGLYWLLLLLSIFSLYYLQDKRIIMLQLIVLIATAMTLITVGHPRYHQIFMPQIILCAAFVVDNILLTFNKDSQQSITTA